MTVSIDAVRCLQSHIRGISYRTRKRQTKKEIVAMCLSRMKVTQSQLDNMDQIHNDLVNARKNKHLPSFDKFTKQDFKTQQEWVSTLENLLKNVEYVHNIKNNIPNMLLAPKRRYKNYSWGSVVDPLFNIVKKLDDGSYMESFIKLGLSSKMLFQNIYGVIKPHIINYLNIPRLSLNNDIILFNYYMRWCNDCINHCHSVVSRDRCPAYYLHTLSKNKNIHNQLRTLIYNNLFKKNGFKKKSYITMLAENHGIIL